MKALLALLLLAGCSSTYESRTTEVLLEEDSGDRRMQEEAGNEPDGGSSVEAGSPEAPPPRNDLCHLNGTPYVGQTCFITIAELPDRGTWMGRSCWVDGTIGGECGCERHAGPPIPCTSD